MAEKQVRNPEWKQPELIPVIRDFDYGRENLGADGKKKKTDWPKVRKEKK